MLWLKRKFGIYRDPKIADSFEHMDKYGPRSAWYDPVPPGADRLSRRVFTASKLFCLYCPAAYVVGSLTKSTYHRYFIDAEFVAPDGAAELHDLPTAATADTGRRGRTSGQQRNYPFVGGDRRQSNEASQNRILGLVEADGKLQSWEQVRPTLRAGDLVFLMGTGEMSWRITNAAFNLENWDKNALRYSHVGVVVGPFPDEVRDDGAAARPGSLPQHDAARFPVLSRVSAAVRQRAFPSPLVGLQARPAAAAAAAGVEPVVLESIDNKDMRNRSVGDTAGGAGDDAHPVLTNQVQLGYATDRVFGRQGDRRCYNRCAVRRLKDFDWTPERKERLEAFLQSVARRPMDGSPKLMAAVMIDPALHPRTANPDVLSCSELIVDFYRAVGAVAPEGKPSVQWAPHHLTAKGFRDIGGVMQERNARFAPEERVAMNLEPFYAAP
jgi:hypothetical protein